MLTTIAPLIAIFAIFYFLMIRPQQQRMKQHRDMVANISRGDTVVTAGGQVAKVSKPVKPEDQEVTVEIADGVIGAGGAQHNFRSAPEERARQFEQGCLIDASDSHLEPRPHAARSADRLHHRAAQCAAGHRARASSRGAAKHRNARPRSSGRFLSAARSRDGSGREGQAAIADGRHPRKSAQGAHRLYRPAGEDRYGFRARHRRRAVSGRQGHRRQAERRAIGGGLLGRPGRIRIDRARQFDDCHEDYRPIPHPEPGPDSRPVARSGAPPYRPVGHARTHHRAAGRRPHPCAGTWPVRSAAPDRSARQDREDDVPVGG